jgi:uncharacterized linocin/CFP29 family protein
MNNLYRELAPVPEAAWAQIEDEARRTFTRNVAARRVVGVVGPGGFTQAAVDDVERGAEDRLVNLQETLTALVQTTEASVVLTR